MRSFLTLARYLVIAALLGVAVLLVMARQAGQTKVLVVHSYNTDMAWVNDIDAGLDRAVEAAKGADGGLVVRTHYMNLRNHPDCQFYRNATSEVWFTLLDWQPDAVILVDDLAQGLVGFNLLDLAPGTDRDAMATALNAWLAGGRCAVPPLDYFGLDAPLTENFPAVVFAGVNGTVTRYGYDDARNVTGIFENKNYTAIVQTLADLQQALGRDVGGIMMLNDASRTGETENETYAMQDWSPFTAFPAVSARTFDDWKAAVARANERDLMLVISNYENVTGYDGQSVDPGVVIAWTEQNAALPVLGLNTRFVADGGMMTVAIAGSEQGEVAMQMADAVLASGTIPRPVKAKQYLIGMNQALVRKRNLEVPLIYEAFSREISKFIDHTTQFYEVKTETQP